MPELHALSLVAVVALVTVAVRFLPFVLFGGARETPRPVACLGRVLPYAIMGMLVVFCLKGVNPLQAPYGIPEALCCLLVALLHLWRKNALLSIAGGTACYMLLVQLVF